LNWKSCCLFTKNEPRNEQPGTRNQIIEIKKLIYHVLPIKVALLIIIIIIINCINLKVN